MNVTYIAVPIAIHIGEFTITPPDIRKTFILLTLKINGEYSKKVLIHVGNNMLKRYQNPSSVSVSHNVQ